jgi:hypothetical protein
LRHLCLKTLGFCQPQMDPAPPALRMCPRPPRFRTPSIHQLLIDRIAVGFLSHSDFLGAGLLLPFCPMFAERSLGVRMGIHAP